MDRREFFEKNPEILRLLPGRYDHSREEMIPDIEEKVRQWVAADYKKLERSYTGTLYKTMRGEFVKSVA